MRDMKNFLSVVEIVKEKIYNITDKGRIKQKEQLELKTSLTNALLKDFESAGVESYAVQKGIVILLQNDEEGAIPLEVTITTKPLDYDYDQLHEEWLEKEAARSEKLVTEGKEV